MLVDDGRASLPEAAAPAAAPAAPAPAPASAPSTDGLGGRVRGDYATMCPWRPGRFFWRCDNEVIVGLRFNPS
jgi:hypothetical protein